MANNSQLRVTINVGGKTFATTQKTLRKLPGTRLAELTSESPSYDRTNEYHFFDRNPRAFGSILDLYRTGQLHFPHCLCGTFLKQELEFWQIGEEHIADCCWRSYRVSQEEAKTMAAVKASLQKYSAAQQFDQQTDSVLSQSQSQSGGSCINLRKLRRRLWIFLEDPTSTTAAKVWGVAYVILILISVASQAMYTHPLFRRTRETPRSNITGITNAKLLLFLTTDISPAVNYAEMVCLGVFSIELFTRIFICPSLARFLSNGYNIIDIVGVVPSLALSLFVRAYPDYMQNNIAFYVVWVLAFFSVFRTLRVLKYAQHHKPVRILLLTLQASLREQLLLCLMICISVLWYSNLIYFAEFHHDTDFETVPIGFWWAIVTMTTVGYGDVLPRTPWGYLIGGVCALTGMLCTGMSIPIIASKFNIYYTYAKFCMRDDKTKTVRRALNAWKKFKSNAKKSLKAKKAACDDKVKRKILSETPSESPKAKSDREGTKADTGHDHGQVRSEGHQSAGDSLELENGNAGGSTPDNLVEETTVVADSLGISNGENKDAANASTNASNTSVSGNVNFNFNVSKYTYDNAALSADEIA